MYVYNFTYSSLAFYLLCKMQIVLEDRFHLYRTSIATIDEISFKYPETDQKLQLVN